MLRFESSQIEAIDRQAESELAFHIAELLRSHRRRHVADLGQTELDAAALASVHDARSLGLSDEGDILLYVTAEIVLRPDFPAGMPDLFETLIDPSIPHEGRSDAVARATTERWP